MNKPTPETLRGLAEEDIFPTDYIPNEIRAHADAWEAERDVLMILSGDDADGLANTCHQFQGELVHKHDEFGARFWREMEIRLRKFAEARRKIEEKP
jgi:hypothetical protein